MRCCFWFFVNISGKINNVKVSTKIVLKRLTRIIAFFKLACGKRFDDHFVELGSTGPPSDLIMLSKKDMRRKKPGRDIL
jgi:hypothetical protein